MSEGTWKMLGIGAALAAVIVTLVAIDRHSKLSELRRQEADRKAIEGAVDAVREWKGHLGRLTRNLSSVEGELEEPLKKLAALDTPDARWWETQARFWMMDYDGALKAVARGGDDPRLVYLKAMILYERQRLSQFRRLFHSGVEVPQIAVDEKLKREIKEAVDALEKALKDKRLKGEEADVVKLAHLALQGPTPQTADEFAKEVRAAIEKTSTYPSAAAQKVCGDAAMHFNSSDADTLYTRARERLPGHYETAVSHAWRLFGGLQANLSDQALQRRTVETALTAQTLRPDRPEAYMILGGIARRFGLEAERAEDRKQNLDAAVDRFESAMRFDQEFVVAALTNRAGAHLARATYFQQAKDAESAGKDFGDALRYAKEAVDKDATSLPAIYVRAQARLAGDAYWNAAAVGAEYDGAIDDFSRVFQASNRKNAEAARSLADGLLRRAALRAGQQGKETEVEADFKASIDMLSDLVKALKEEETPRFYSLRARAYATRASWYAAVKKEARPEYDAAVADFKKACEKLDKDKDLALEYGRMLMGRGAFDVAVGGVDAPTALQGAVDQFGAVVKAFPDSSDGFLMRGLCHLQVAGALKKAGQDASKSFDAFDADIAGVLKIDENNADAYQIHGESNEMRERWAEAERDYLQAIKIDGRRMQSLGARVKAIREKTGAPPPRPPEKPPEKAPEKAPEKTPEKQP